MRSLLTKITKILRFINPSKLLTSKDFWQSKRGKYIFGLFLDVLCLGVIFSHGFTTNTPLISPLVNLQPLSPLTASKSSREVFGFAPYWTIDKLQNVDFKVLTTLAYFGLDVDADGNLDRLGQGYATFISPLATQIFRKAHANGTRVSLTLTQMDNATIEALMDDKDAQKNLITQTVKEVKNRGIDGVNIDFEYSGNPGQQYRNKFTDFMHNLISALRQEIPQSEATVSVYASAITEPKIYDIQALGKEDLKIFMMAYDFGYSGSDQVIPTAPLYGHKEGKYWYDVASAVEDFLAFMPAEKLILGTPWYGYNYAIYGNPKVKAETRPSWSWRGGPAAQTYSIAKANVKPTKEGITDYKEGWDDLGKVAWKAYYVEETDTWRMIFIDDAKSLEYKYEFAKQKNLGGVGIWALGFDEGTTELWALLEKEFGPKKYADSKITMKSIKENYE